MPYLTCHSDKHDTSIVWMNSAETFVDILETADKRLVTWVSESGVMELFLLGNTVSPSAIMRKLATITGYAKLPPYFSLGFHYSKWEDISTERLSAILDEFNRQEMPLDVLWLDIEYTKDKKYFEFDEDKFQNLDTLLATVQQQEKRLTVITDPHIKVDEQFFVYREGMKQVVSTDITGMKERSVFVRDKE